MASSREKKQQSIRFPIPLDFSFNNFNFGNKVQAGEDDYEKIETHNDDLVNYCGREMPEEKCHNHTQVIY